MMDGPADEPCPVCDAETPAERRQVRCTWSMVAPPASALLGDARLPLDLLRDLEGLIASAPVTPDGSVVLLRDGMLTVARAAIAAEAELERLQRSLDASPTRPPWPLGKPISSRLATLSGDL